MSEWIHEGLPPYGHLAECWMANDAVRHVLWSANGWRFLDCTHPMQNVCCDPENIKAWRLADEMRYTAEQMHEYAIAERERGGLADAKTKRLADIALSESIGVDITMDWMSAALEVCRRVRNAEKSPG